MSYYILLIILGSMYSDLAYGAEQTVVVQGTIICQSGSASMYAANAEVELWDYDRVGGDDLLAVNTSSSHGQYFISGGEDEYLSLAPYIRVRTHCSEIPNSIAKRCSYEVDVPIDHDGSSQTFVGVTVTIDTKSDRIVCS